MPAKGLAVLLVLAWSISAFAAGPYTSLYYQTFPPAPIKKPNPKKTALLIVDMQNAFVLPDQGDALAIKKAGQWPAWEYYYRSLEQEVIPSIKKLLTFFRAHGLEVNHARISALHQDGRDRSPVQRGQGYNDILLRRADPGAQIVAPLQPAADEPVLEKTTDSVLMGTNYERMLRNMGIEYVVVTGIVTDQCVSSTVRDLADAGFYVYLPDDATTAATEAAKGSELTALNHIYAQVLSSDAMIDLLQEDRSPSAAVGR